MKDLTNFNFGLRVKELLEQRNISSTQFLKATGIPNQRYYDWCNKRAMPNVLTAMKVAEFFNMSVEQLIKGTTDDPLANVVESLEIKLGKIRELCG